ncbi:RAMP superfamily CRISPR-associated protein [Leptolyngbya sp. AN03gr2]|uniref:RAMP superfamily CRISPR-associated protein n=1 Tax=unclassified Leptolyngbya TaxID=2650499 RepID=UPI003D310FE9
MTTSRPIRKSVEPKPYELIPFPKEKPTPKHPVGHDQYKKDCYHGSIKLILKVKTAVHVSTGIVALGTDVKSKVPLIKTMTQGKQQKLAIAGSSLKGAVRSIYETITNSTLAVVANRKYIPDGRFPCRNKQELCPASLVFGALDWQGLIQFSDAICQKAESATGFMPSLYRPRPDEYRGYLQNGKAVGRKFYYHAIKAVDGGQQGIPVQQAGAEYVFTTQLQFKNLADAELGALFIALGQDQQHPFALKVGGGKPIGMGTMTVEISAIAAFQNVRDRYRHYTLSDSVALTGQPMREFIQARMAAAHRHKLIEMAQLQQLSEILKFPTDRKAPQGMY